ncbi:putative PurR-regulated permease PerM [Agromyces flavus]|uniref:PurR-regulated permease PerM n=2 Tax=Actinomycetes TaxID=1760 RepID=A0A1H1ZCF5_9MICO|nr:AI-2E family transporter [Agromyces flavus]MCP2367027.1 putative PurR-regulated permease PerM [Agromyces flavus]GGI46546.1 AI-2E family transporter [Agromyces flavus]SDT31360.1 Predicted PurR-regulated permease PerM [Agromyces flavus]
MSAPAPAPGLRAAVVLIATLLAVGALWFAREIVAPLALGAVLVIIVHPLRHPLQRRGWPRWAATTVVIAVAYLILAVLAALLVFAGVQFAQLVTDVLDELQAAAASVVDWLSSVGLGDQVADATSSALDPAALLDLVQGASGWLVGFVTAAFFVLAYVIFMAADAARYGRAERALGSGVRPAIDRIRAYNSSVRRYYVVNASFGAVVAVIDGLALWALGIPVPAVWAILAFVTNFIPNIGFVLGVIPPAVLAFVVGGVPLMISVLAIYSVVNVVLQVLVQPKFVSDAVDLSLTLSFVSVVFWTFVIGPLGAILSIPLTLLVRDVLLDRDPDARFLRWLSGDARVPQQTSSGSP